MRMHILLISPYHSGSHQAWAEGYARHSKHTVELLTLPGRFWKWRMHGGAVTLARQWLEGDRPMPDLIVTDGMLDLSTFLALTRRKLAHVPTVLYMHENQLTYPLPVNPKTGAMRRQRGERDHHYVFINYVSMLSADRIAFNSAYHLKSWFDALPRFLKHFPEYNELASIERLRERSAVLPVGVTFPANMTPLPPRPLPLIVWNQRWEYDKNPEAFFAALYAAAERGVAFEVALCGENFSRKPHIFDEAHERLGGRIIHSGYASREKYWELLRSADLTISTAIHEFFGISIIEAIGCGTFPILPNRLSYPELIAAEFHAAVLYESDDVLIERLMWALTQRDEARQVALALQQSVQQYRWDVIGPRTDTWVLDGFGKK